MNKALELYQKAQEIAQSVQHPTTGRPPERYNKPHIFKSKDGEWLARVVIAEKYVNYGVMQRKGASPFSAYRVLVQDWAVVSRIGATHRVKYSRAK